MWGRPVTSDQRPSSGAEQERPCHHHCHRSETMVFGPQESRWTGATMHQLHFPIYTDTYAHFHASAHQEESFVPITVQHRGIRLSLRPSILQSRAGPRHAMLCHAMPSYRRHIQNHITFHGERVLPLPSGALRPFFVSLLLAHASRSFHHLAFRSRTHSRTVR